LKAGDVITKFDGKPIKEIRDFKPAAATPVGKDVELVIVRSGKEQVKTVGTCRLEDGEKTAANDAGARDKIEPANPASQIFWD